MEKELKSYKNNLIILVVCFVLVIFTNLHLFFEFDFIKLIYGIILVIIGCFTFKALMVFNTDILLSAKISSITGVTMTLMLLFESFNYGKDLIVNFRLGGLFILVGGILIFNTSRKIKKYYSQN